MIIVNGFQPLTINTKRSIMDVAAVLDPSVSISHTTRTDLFMRKNIALNSIYSKKN